MGECGLILKKAESKIAKKGKNRITDRVFGYTTKAYKVEGGNLLRKSKRTAASAALPQNMAAYLFHQGTNFYAYEYLGAHFDGEKITFRVWAPNAEFVSVCGDFNDWNRDADPMTRITERGVWELMLPASRVAIGQCYKYCIRSRGRELLKADPYGFSMQRPPETASLICNIGGYTWRDDDWLAYRKSHFDRTNCLSQPINIYEMHLGSWKRHADGSYYSYAEIASDLAPYLKQMGYTHVEVMPVSEHPFDGSWGYQVCGYYAPTSRFGKPQDFMAFVDAMHEAGIGVILDWVPAHFAKDAHGLYEFDGQPLYEYQGWDRIEHEGWGTRRFDVGREEVQSFLISNAIYWLKEYHIDALRVDALASMLYLDYDKRPGEWVPNVYGDNKCLEAIAFFQKMNGYLAANYPDVMTIAEESASIVQITGFENEGLGFSYKWNMGWMNDTLSYVKEEPQWRSYHHGKMNFSIMYSFGEHYVLSISHDEVVHGKKSLLDKMAGDYATKFAGARTYLTYMMTHPGKKLLFMGSEIGMFREWDHDGEVEWFLLNYDMHAKYQLFVSRLNHFYLEHPELWNADEGPASFEWIDPDNSQESILSYRRIAKNGEELVVYLNFLPEKREGFLAAVPKAGKYEEVFNSDAIEFGGEGNLNKGILTAKKCTLPRGYTHAVSITLPPMGAVILKKKKTRQKIKNNI